MMEGLPLGDAPEGFELIDDALSRRRIRLAGEKVTDIHQDLHHELVPLVGVVQLLRAPRLFRLLGGVEGGLVDVLEVAEDRVAGAHMLWKLGDHKGWSEANGRWGDGKGAEVASGRG